ncbi:MAG: GGDEF domain-containing protein [Pyrinomonadaceae bacterium]
MTALSALVMCISMLITSANYPQVRGIRKWAWGCGAQTVGWALMALRDNIHDFFSIVVANTLIIISAAFFYQAISNFKGKKSQHLIFFPLITLFFLSFNYFTFIQPSFAVRSIITSSFGSGITFFCAYLLLFNRKVRPSISEWVMGIGFLSIAVTAFVRIFDMIFNSHDSELFVSTNIHTLVFGLVFISILILTFSFSLMINDKFMAEILRLATLDALTEIYNRAALEKLINKEMDRSKRYGLPMSILLLDLDHFKKVNDNYGHQVGDFTLKTLVQSITKVLRDHDILGRFGGEEFMILLPDTDLKNSQIVAERVRRMVEKTKIRMGKTTLKVTISIGLATLRKEGDNFQDLFRRADLGLYKAKQTGRNRVVAIREDNFTSTEMREVEGDIFKSNPHLEIPVKLKEDS